MYRLLLLKAQVF